MTKTLLLAFALMFSTVWLQAQDQSPQDQSPQATPQEQSPQNQQPQAQSPQAAPQDQTAPTDSGQAGSTTGQMGSGAAGQTSVEGCLGNSNGNYTLMTTAGTTYQLQGDTAKLSKHVGHEVRITGTTSGASTGTATGSASSEMGGGASQGQAMLDVQRVKHISKNCNNSGMTK